MPRLNSTNSIILIALLILAAFITGALVGPDVLKPILGEILTQVTETPAASSETASEPSDARVKGIPEKAYTVLAQVLAGSGEPPQGYRGGRTFYNDGRDGEQLLPTGISYREYDVNPYIKGQNRGAERLVIGSDGSAWYTANHYRTYTRIR